mmetsp:Transcript_44105/g.103178  ORF Transcript_44105/g.103178 Transcript_44105/m.103178 type:complete len:98 (+) Transcript_44105:372-665(+)
MQLSLAFPRNRSLCKAETTVQMDCDYRTTLCSGRTMETRLTKSISRRLANSRDGGKGRSCKQESRSWSHAARWKSRRGERKATDVQEEHMEYTAQGG